MTLDEIYERVKDQFQIEILTGREYMNVEVGRIYYMEDIDISNWTRSGELIMTTAMKTTKDSNWLKKLVDSLLPYEPSGILVNLGGYMEEIPQEVVEYCNENHLPLMVFPWEVYLQDVTKEVTNLIFLEEQKKNDIQNGFLNAIFNPELEDDFEPCMRKLGLKKNEKMKVALVSASSSDIEGDMRYLKQVLSRKSSMSFCITYQRKLIIVCYGDELVRMKDLLKECLVACHKVRKDTRWIVGIGNQVASYGKLSDSFQKANACKRISESKGVEVTDFKDLDVIGLLLGCDEMQIKAYYEKQLGELIRHDQENHTEYVKLLEVYLKYNGNTKEVSEELYVHRNTVGYRLKKIEEILKKDLKDLHEILKIQVAFYIPYFMEV